MAIRIGRWRFAPSWWTTVLVIVLVAVFASLGRWQWQRAAEKRETWREMAAPSSDARPLGSRGLDELKRYVRLELSGRFDVERQFLLENRTLGGRAGYEVLTPFVLEDGRALLVNRGWIPFEGRRDRLPDVSLAALGRVTITGRVDQLPSPGLEGGRAAPSHEGHWPKVTSYPTIEQLAGALGRRLEPRILLLDREAPFGYVRQWRPSGTPPERHWAYAFQWWSLAAVLLAMYVTLNLRKSDGR